MGWLQRLFGQEKPQDAQVNPSPTEDYIPPPAGTAPSVTEAIPPERLGLSGEYDQSGLAKRVALAFDDSSDLDDIDTLYVAQTGSTVVFKGQVPSQQILNEMIAVALQVNGATNVDSDQVTIG